MTDFNPCANLPCNKIPSCITTCGKLVSGQLSRGYCLPIRVRVSFKVGGQFFPIVLEPANCCRNFIFMRSVVCGCCVNFIWMCLTFRISVYFDFICATEFAIDVATMGHCSPFCSEKLHLKLFLRKLPQLLPFLGYTYNIWLSEAKFDD